jgi:hypothetical protein
MEIEDRLFKISEECFGADKTILLSKSRDRHIIDLQRCIINIMRKEGYTLKKIGFIMNKHHATIIHYVSSFDILLDSEKEFQEMYNIFSEEFYNQYGGEAKRKRLLDIERLEASVIMIKKRLDTVRNDIKKIKQTL